MAAVRMVELSRHTAALAVAAAALAARAPLPSGSWENEGHTYVNQVAAEHLPEEMPAFFRHAGSRLAHLGAEPDRWREESEHTLKNSQEADHYIKFEVLGPDFDFDRDRYSYYTKLYERRAELEAAGRGADHLLPVNVGLQPYITVEIFDRLKVAFRQYRALLAEGASTELVEGNIILYAGWLGHYVADGAQPQHTSVHYDGWHGANPQRYAGPGIHATFEGEFVRRNISAKDFSDRVGPPLYLEDPFVDYLSFLKQSTRLVEEVYRIDRTGGFDGAGSERALQFTRARLAAASQMLLNLWYTAWADSAGGEGPAAKPD